MPALVDVGECLKGRLKLNEDVRLVKLKVSKH